MCVFVVLLVDLRDPSAALHCMDGRTRNNEMGPRLVVGSLLRSSDGLSFSLGAYYGIGVQY